LLEVPTFEKDELKFMISDGRVEEVFTLLLETILVDKTNNQAYRNEIFALRRRYNETQQNLDKGLIDLNGSSLTTNRIALTLMRVLDEIAAEVDKSQEQAGIQSDNKATQELNRYQEALSLASLGVWEWTENDQEYHSPMWKKMLGFKAEELDADTLVVWETLLHPEDRETAISEFEAFKAGIKQVYNPIFRLMCKNGSYKVIWSQAEIKERNLEGLPTRILGIHMDAAHELGLMLQFSRFEEDVEQLKAAILILEEERKEFYQQIRQDWELLTTAMEKMKDKLRSFSPDNPGYLSELKSIFYDMSNLHALIQSTLNLSRSHAETWQKEFNLEQTLANLIDELEEIWRSRPRDLRPSVIEEGIPPVLQGNFTELRALLYWLIRMGMKYTQEGDLHINIRKAPLQQKPSFYQDTIVPYLEADNYITLEFSLMNEAGNKLAVEKRQNLQDYYQGKEVENEFINEELGKGFRQVLDMVDLMGGEFMISQSEEEADFGIRLHLSFGYQLAKS